MEYKFVAYSWDGFQATACTMLEAKWGYECPQALVNGDARRRTEARDRRGERRFLRLVDQAGRQKSRLTAYREVRLHWMFAHFDSYIFFCSVGGNALMADGKMTIEHRPGPTG